MSRAPVVIAGVELRRFLRDRSNIFFVFVFPLLLVLLIGAQFGGDGGGRAVVAGEGSALRTALVAALRAQDVEVADGDREGALEQVARVRADVAVLLDERAATAYAAREPVEVTVVPGSQATARTAVQEVQAALGRLTAERGQVAALVDAGLGPDEAEAALGEARKAVAAPRIRVESVDELAEEFEGLGRFDFGASGQLLLFVFVSSLTGATSLIQARRLGVVARTLSAPVTPGQLMTGEVLGRLAIALFQGGYIMLATALLFGVGWGNLAVSVTVLAVFAVVAAGAAMLVGAVFDNEGTASGIGVGLGLVLAALGGSMFPLELFPDTMNAVAHATPHAWAYEAFAELQRRSGGLLDVLPQLAVLAAMAVVVVAAGAWALRRSLARAL